jgi:hypothetical protein
MVENIIGQIETPTRHLIEAAADFISAKTISFTSVLSRDDADRLQTQPLKLVAMFISNIPGENIKESSLCSMSITMNTGSEVKPVTVSAQLLKIFFQISILTKVFSAITI